MKTRHAAALALTWLPVTWLLMAPPSDNYALPLASWTIQFKEKTIAKCEDLRIGLVTAELALLMHNARLNDYKLDQSAKPVFALAISKCVASNDPRLKTK